MKYSHLELNPYEIPPRKVFSLENNTPLDLMLSTNWVNALSNFSLEL